MKIFFRKEKISFGSFFSDRIVGFHLYKQGNVVIEDSYSLRNAANSTTRFSSYLGTNRDGGDVLSGILDDISKDKGLRLTLSIDSSHTSMVWHLTHAGITVNKPSGITLPRDFLLTKL